MMQMPAAAIHGSKNESSAFTTPNAQLKGAAPPKAGTSALEALVGRKHTILATFCRTKGGIQHGEEWRCWIRRRRKRAGLQNGNLYRPIKVCTSAASDNLDLKNRAVTSLINAYKAAKTLWCSSRTCPELTELSCYYLSPSTKLLSVALTDGRNLRRVVGWKRRSCVGLFKRRGRRRWRCLHCRCA